MTGSKKVADDRALIEELARLPPDEQERACRRLTMDQRRELLARWPLWAHDGQLSPDGEPFVWLILAGRGFGKTRAGAEWMTERAIAAPDGRFALVGATIEDACRVMVEGPAGVLTAAQSRGLATRWWKASGEVRFPNGAIMTIYAASAPEALRGPEHHAAWCDEVGKWGRGGEAAFSNLMLGLRAGNSARVLVTTTPRSTALLNHIVALAKKNRAITQGRSRDNVHLPASFLAAMMDQYGGTRLGRQELEGELLDDHDGALWSRELIERCRAARDDMPALVRVVVAVDPPAGVDGDACGIVAAGLGADGVGYVLEDASIAGASPPIAPGTLVGIDGEGGTWRVTEAALEAMVTTLTCVRVTPPAPVASATPGRALPAPDRVAGTTILHVAELPALGDSPLAAPRLSVTANGTGTGWRRAALLYSLDDGASWRDGGETAAPAIVGVLASVPAAAAATLADLATSFEVDLARADMVLGDADDAALDGGGNLALAGGELLQFGRAEQIGAARWRLSRLWRGRRGTETAAGMQAIGDRFALLTTDAVAAIDLPVAAIGSVVRVLASGIGDAAGPAAVTCAIDGASVRPPCPAQLRLEIVAGTPTLTWARRSRAGFRWIDGGDVPLAEESEAYRVTITPPTSAPRVVTVADRACALDPGEAAGGTIVEVRQIGTFGESPAATLILS